MARRKQTTANHAKIPINTERIRKKLSSSKTPSTAANRRPDAPKGRDETFCASPLAGSDSVVLPAAGSFIGRPPRDRVKGEEERDLYLADRRISRPPAA